MITKYHRPQTIEEALALLAREKIRTRPLGGGTTLNRRQEQDFEAVDLQNLDLNGFQKKGKVLSLGATLTLQSLLEDEIISPILPEALKLALRYEATYNLRQIATVAGTLVSANGRSAFTTAMLALDVRLEILPEYEMVKLGDLLPFRDERLNGRLVSRVEIPLNVRLCYQYVARTPADLPIVCVAVAGWQSGRRRIALGGYGEMPLLAFDGTEADGGEVASRYAYSQAEDQWASAEYRSEVVGVLTQRCLDNLA